MRAADGVWLSCTPTESYLLVSLDFEGKSSIYRIMIIACLIGVRIGVHSIERSAQEDALLVLFNAAVSNLVCPKLADDPLYAPDLALQILFRNNFALSRDIAGLFTVCPSSLLSVMCVR